MKSLKKSYYHFLITTFNYCYFLTCRSLDLSCNRISLDITSQKKLLTKILSPMTSLQSFSIAYNTIQDGGLELLCNIFMGTILHLKTLDVARCNLSGKALFSLNLLCTCTNLEDIFIQDNLFTSDQVHKIKAMSKASDDDVVHKVHLHVDDEYEGIALPLRYSVDENGEIY